MDIYHVINMVISAIAVLVAFMSWKDKRTKEQTKNVADQIKELQLASAAQIRELQDNYRKTEIAYNVLEERLKNTIELLHRLDTTLDQINDELDERD